MSLPDIGVQLVKTADDVVEFLAWVDSRLSTYVAIDTETTGLSWWNPDFTRLIQFGSPDVSYVVPVSWWGRVVHEAMRRIVAHGTTVVFHNAKFDMHAIENARWPLPQWSQVEDTAILLHLRRSNLPRSLKGRHAAALLGPWVYHLKENLPKHAREQYGIPKAHLWTHIPVDDTAYVMYGGVDTCITARLFEALVDTRRDFAPQVDREYLYQEIMYRAECRGILVDTGYTQELRGRLTAEIERDLAFLQAQGVANPNSNNQVLDMLEGDFGFVPWEWTETGQPSLNKHVLGVLAQSQGLQGDVIEALVRYKRNVKWRSTYVDTFLTATDIHGLVHPSINTMQARTGRSSISNPALQTLPSGDSMIRHCLLPPKKYQWYSLDYSNQEPRTLAHYGQSPELLRYFTEGDGTGSIHDFVAEQMFGPQYTKEQRALAKVFGLSRSYGAGAAKMAQASGLHQAEVERLLPAYDELVGLAGLNAKVGEAALARAPEPYILTAGGRRSYCDEDQEYTLVNYLMQGSGADMLKDATIRLDRAGLSDYINVPVHDEITFSFPREEGDAMAEEARKLMETDEFAVPMPVDIDGPGKSWGALYD